MTQILIKLGVASSLVLAASLLTFATPAMAEDPTSLGKFEAWEAFTYKAEDSKVCYVFASPSKSEQSKKVTRDPAYLMITHWPGRKIKGQISTMIGYRFKENSTVKMAVGDSKFELYPIDNMAWTDKPETEKAIVNAMKTGSAMTVFGVSKRGTETTDT